MKTSDKPKCFSCPWREPNNVCAYPIATECINPDAVAVKKRIAGQVLSLDGNQTTENP